MNLPDINLILNIVLALGITYAGVFAWRRIHSAWCWLFVALGLAWFGFYVYLGVGDGRLDYGFLQAVFVRPTITLTLTGVMCLLLLVSKLWIPRR